MTKLIRSSFITCLILTVISGCAFFNSNQTALRLTITYATQKVIERGDTLDEQRQKAANIKRIATDVRALVAGDQVTLESLQSVVNKELEKVQLSPADRTLANEFVKAIIAELQTKIGNGLLKPSDLVAVTTVLDWIISATNYYA